MADTSWKDINVLRRELLMMGTKSLIKRCKSQNLQFNGNKGDIVNRLLAHYDECNPIKPRRHNKQTSTKKKTESRRQITSLFIEQSFTKCTEENKVQIRNKTNKKKRRKRKLQCNNNTDISDTQRMDQILSVYYKQMGRHNYFRCTNKKKLGKFAVFCEDNALNSQQIKDAILNDLDNFGLFSFDPQFPLNDILPLDQVERSNEIRQILRFCYVHNVAPSPKKTKASIISHSELQLVINGYIRTIASEMPQFPLNVTNICIKYSEFNVYDLTDLNFDVISNNDMVLKVNTLYTEQCGDILGDICNNDVKLLAFGYLNRWPQFIQYLVDCYLTKMAQKQKNPLNEECILRYLKSLKWIKQFVLTNKENSNRLFAQFVSDVKWYLSDTIMTPLRTDAYFYRNIRDDSYAICYYIMSAMRFVSDLVYNHNNAPFQFDFCILFKEVKMQKVTTYTLLSDDDNDSVDSFTYHGSDAYDSDSDSSDIEFDYNALNKKCNTMNTTSRNYKLDIIGDIKQRIKATKCISVIKHIDSQFHHDIDCDTDFEGELLRTFNETFEAFKEKVSDDKQYPHKKRFVAVIDRRTWIGNETRANAMDGKDEFIMFEPPKSRKCNELEAGTYTGDKQLAEQYHNKCAQCLIPGIYFNEEFKENQYKKSRYEELSADVSETINCVSNTNGSMMTLSFHCEAHQQIKCYLWFKTGHLRFYPHDIQNILSKAFMLDVENNAYFLYDSMIRKQLNALQIKDKYFEHFYEAMTHKKFKHSL